MPAQAACTIRLATPDDVGSLQVVLDGSSGLTHADVYGLHASGLLGEHQVHIAFVADEPIGCIMATAASTTIIHGLSIVGSHRGRGHASALIQAVIDHNDGVRGPHTYWTAADAEIAGALDRFERLGFEPVDESRYGLTLLIRRSPASASTARPRATNDRVAAPERRAVSRPVSSAGAWLST